MFKVTVIEECPIISMIALGCAPAAIKIPGNYDVGRGIARTRATRRRERLA